MPQHDLMYAQFVSKKQLERDLKEEDIIDEDEKQ